MNNEQVRNMGQIIKRKLQSLLKIQTESNKQMPIYKQKVTNKPILKEKVTNTIKEQLT